MIVIFNKVYLQNNNIKFDMIKMRLVVISVISSLFVCGLRGLKTSCKLQSPERLIEHVNMINLQISNRYDIMRETYVNLQYQNFNMQVQFQYAC